MDGPVRLVRRARGSADLMGACIHNEMKRPSHAGAFKPETKGMIENEAHLENTIIR
jgi:hypothetical protein